MDQSSVGKVSSKGGKEIEAQEQSHADQGRAITKDVVPFALMVGNPARQQGWVSKHGNKLVFDENNWAIYEATGEPYVLKDSTVLCL